MYLQFNTVTYLTYAKILSNVSRIGPNPGTIFAVILRSVSFLKNIGLSRPLFVYFRPFDITIQLQIEKVWMFCLGFEHGAASR